MIQGELFETKSTKLCTKCKDTLTDDNWYKSDQKKHIHRCISCGLSIRKINRLKQQAREAGKISLGAYNRTPEGYVYAITNPAWEGWVKIGMAMDADDRCKSYQTSSPYRDYRLEHCVYFKDRRKAEQKAHEKAEKIADECGAEWFKMPVDKAIKIIGDIK